MLLQVLYALHQGNVQFLMGGYRTLVLDTHGPDAFPKVRAQRLGKDGLPRTILDGHAPDPNPVVYIMSKDDDDGESTDSKDSGSDIHYTSGGEEGKANTPVLSAHPTDGNTASPDGNVDAS